MMKLKVADLKDESRFRLLKKLEFSGMMDFVFTNIKHKNAINALYFGLLIVSLSYTIILSIKAIYLNQIGFGRWFLDILFGFITANSLIIILHEGLHGLGYKLVGSPTVNFGAKLDQYIFYAVADQFVISKWPFYFVAMLPFFTISSICVAYIFLIPWHIWFWLSLFFFHTVMCIGDFAMVSFFYNKSEKEILMFDNVEEEIAYFYEKLT